VDTPYAYELNAWYHTLNAGYRTRISGETDFPCIYDERMGLGRSYVRQAGVPTYRDWADGIREGRNYVSDGKSHLIDLRVNGVQMGAGQDILLKDPGRVHVTARVAALLDPTPDETIRKQPYNRKPYWNLERSRVGDTRRVPVELIVNGLPVARKEIDADGETRPIEFDVRIEKSAWVALRILPSSHTNPVWVTVSGKPVRVKSSLEWCLKSVDQCERQKMPLIRLEEKGAAKNAYDHARAEYRKRLAEN